MRTDFGIALEIQKNMFFFNVTPGSYFCLIEHFVLTTQATSFAATGFRPAVCPTEGAFIQTKETQNFFYGSTLFYGGLQKLHTAW